MRLRTTNYDDECGPLVGWINSHSHPMPPETVAAFNAWRLKECAEFTAKLEASPDRYGFLSPDDPLREPRWIAKGSAHWQDGGFKFSPIED